MVLRLLVLLHLYLTTGGPLGTGPVEACIHGTLAPMVASRSLGLAPWPVESSLAETRGDAVMTTTDEPLEPMPGFGEAAECDSEDDGPTPALFLPAHEGFCPQPGMPTALGARSLPYSCPARRLPLRC